MKGVEERLVRMLRSHRGNPVAWSCADFPPPYRPVVTVELASKWYGLLLVGTASNSSVEVPFPNQQDVLPGEVQWVDHVPNPKVVACWAERNGYDVDELAMDLMVGRWVQEVEGRMP